MIRRIGDTQQVVTSLPIKEAAFPAPFPSGLEYAAPARGTWNIVHVGMLIPQAHQIFVCAQGCLRGVVLTAAEIGASERFSTIAIRENNILQGDLEALLIDGVCDILEKLPQLPPAVLVYTSCVHHFMGCDLAHVYRTLAQKYPMVRFTDCYMNPIMRKSGLNPDQTMRRQLYSLLSPMEKDEKSVTLAGNDFVYNETSELRTLLCENGYTIREVAACKTFDEYLQIAQSSMAITTFPAAKPAGDYLQKEHGQKHLYLPFSFDYDEILANYQSLCDALSIPMPDYTAKIDECETALHALKEYIGQTPITIDYTACPRPLGLAKLLLSRGMNVQALYVDSFPADEKGDYAWLREHAPNLTLYPTVHPQMRVLPRVSEGKTLAIGQKAAYFTGTDHFVNMVEGGGMYGFDGILRLVREMTEAYHMPKDTKKLIQIKGWGCGCSL